MRIAVVGAGISGMVAAYRLSREHSVTLFEAGAYAGGHTHTVEVASRGRPLAIDTGFIVHNPATYPNFVALLAELGVATSSTTMSFSVKCTKGGLEYNGTSLNGLFAQRKNLFRPAFLRMVADILAFNRDAKTLLRQGGEASLEQFLYRQGYSDAFLEHYILPMGAAIWSSSPLEVLKFPARFFLQFFANHGFLSVNDRPVWRVIDGGSYEYVKPLTAPYARQLRLNTPVASVERQPRRVALRLKDGRVEHFDALILACHSDQALKLLSDPSREETEILSAIRYQRNDVLLHTDAKLMPTNKRAWAAWNYHVPEAATARVTVTYWMNRLQNLAVPDTYFVSLNANDRVDESKVLGRFVYHHPLFTPGAVAAQKRHAEINGLRRTYFAGAYWGYGFHEDGVVSALRCVQAFKRDAHAEPHLQRVG